MVFPYCPIARGILVNATLIWMGMRFAAAAMGWGLRTSLPLGVFIVLLTTGLAVFDVRKRMRYVLIENLGVRGLPVGLLAAFPPVVFESLWLVLSST